MIMVDFLSFWSNLFYVIHLWYVYTGILMWYILTSLWAYFNPQLTSWSTCESLHMLLLLSSQFSYWKKKVSYNSSLLITHYVYSLLNSRAWPEIQSNSSLCYPWMASFFKGQPQALIKINPSNVWYVWTAFECLICYLLCILCKQCMLKHENPNEKLILQLRALCTQLLINWLPYISGYKVQPMQFLV